MLRLVVKKMRRGRVGVKGNLTLPCSFYSCSGVNFYAANQLCYLMICFMAVVICHMHSYVICVQ